MQVKSYTDLKALIQALAGVSSFTTEEDSKILSFVNRRAAEAYNLSPSWTRYLGASEKRTIATLSVFGASTYTYVNQGYIVVGQKTDGSNVYQGVTDSTIYLHLFSNDWFFVTGGTLVEDSDGFYSVSGGFSAVNSQGATYASNPWEVTDWTSESTLLVQQKSFIPYTESGRNDISEFIRIHRTQAFLKNSALEYDFYVDVDGANILNITSGDDTSAFVTYKKELPTFTADSTNFPLEFFYFVAHAAYADFLRMDGQHGKALTEEEIAKNYLAIELEKIDIRNNNNSINHKFSTYVNRQSR